MKSHKFWETQPVAAGNTNFYQGEGTNPFWLRTPEVLYDPDVKMGRIVSPALEDFLPHPVALPNGYEWRNFDVDKSEDVKTLCGFLREYYATDSNDKFRVSYSDQCVLWNLCTPGYRKDWHIGVYKSSGNVLVATILAIPSVVRVLDQLVPLVQINFLCVRPAYRSKSLASIMIKEISRRVAKTDVMSAIYTTALELPHVITVAQYYHRPLNIKKLINLGFCYKHQKLSMTGTMKFYTLPDFQPCKGLRVMKHEDIEQAYQLLNGHLQKFKVATQFSVDEFRHHFTPRDDVVWSYVEEKEGKIVNFVSFYSVDTVVIANNVIIKSAYLSYIVDVKVMPEILHIATKLNFDLFNCIDVMQNSNFIKDCKFIVGTGKSHYYFYNWKCPIVDRKDMGVILI